MQKSRSLSRVFGGEILSLLGMPMTHRLEVRKSKVFRESVMKDYVFTGIRMDEKNVKSLICCTAAIAGCRLSKENPVVVCHLPEQAPFYGAFFHAYLSDQAGQSFFSITKK